MDHPRSPDTENLAPVSRHISKVRVRPSVQQSMVFSFNSSAVKQHSAHKQTHSKRIAFVFGPRNGGPFEELWGGGGDVE